MSKPTVDSDRKEMQALADRLVEAGRRGGPAGVHDFIDHGGFDLPAFLRDFETGWRLLLRYPLVWFRHKRWVESCKCAGASSMADWAALKAAEQNIAIAEFGQRRLDSPERMRLRLIRQGHKQGWWQFRDLLNSLAVTSPDGRIELRAPPKIAIQVLSGIRLLWVVTCLYLLASATMRFISTGCLTCDVFGIYVLLPGMIGIWWFIHVCSDGWRNAWSKLNDMAIGSVCR
jgi:hypothetical protein